MSIDFLPRQNPIFTIKCGEVVAKKCALVITGGHLTRLFVVGLMRLDVYLSR